MAKYKTEVEAPPVPHMFFEVGDVVETPSGKVFRHYGQGRWAQENYVSFETSPGGGNRKRGTVVTTGNGFSGLPAGRLQELLSWVKPVHLPILDPAQFVGMTPITSGAMTISHVAGAGDFSYGAVRLATSGAVTNLSALLPITDKPAGTFDGLHKAAATVHVRLKCSDWSKITRLYVSFCQNGGSTDRQLLSIVGDPKTVFGGTDPLFADRWNGVYRTVVVPAAKAIKVGAPANWGEASRYLDSITGVFFTVTSTAAVTIDIDRIYSPDWPVGVVVPIFDGWYDTAREFAISEFLPRGWGCGGSVVSGIPTGESPGESHLRELADCGFDVYAHGHDLAAELPAPIGAGTTADGFAKILARQSMLTRRLNGNTTGAMWHQWYQNSSGYNGTDMAGVLKRFGINACRHPCSDAEFGYDPYRSDYVASTNSVIGWWAWVPQQGRFNRPSIAAYNNVAVGADYAATGLSGTSRTLMQIVDHVAQSGLPVHAYNHRIVESPTTGNVTPKFARDWVAHMDELEKQGKILVLNPTTLEQLTYWRPGETFMRWDGEWVYRHDPSKIAF